MKAIARGAVIRSAAGSAPAAAASSSGAVVALRATLHVAMMTPAAAAEAVALRIMAVGRRILLRLAAARDEGRQADHVAVRSAGLLRLTIVKARLVILTRLMIVAVLAISLPVLTILPVVARLVVVMLRGGAGWLPPC